MSEEESKEINPDCPCTWPCERHGNCKACQAYHKGCGDKTCCGK